MSHDINPPLDDAILDDLFHGAAWQAWLEQAALQQRPPDSEPTRRRAYELYEQALAERRRRPRQ